jgi:hypothetical protein
VEEEEEGEKCQGRNVRGGAMEAQRSRRRKAEEEEDEEEEEEEEEEDEDEEEEGRRRKKKKESSRRGLRVAFDRHIAAVLKLEWELNSVTNATKSRYAPPGSLLMFIPPPGVGLEEGDEAGWSGMKHDDWSRTNQNS